jgi:hypothetical protein
MGRTILAVMLGLALGGGCATQAKSSIGDGRTASTAPANGNLLDENAEQGDARRPGAAPTGEPLPTEPPTSVAATGLAPGPADARSIGRGELNRVLDAAPGRFLAKIDSEPRFRDGRFHGWRLRAFFPGDPRFARVDLRPGDVVVRVNGQRLERPDDLFSVWTALRTARELVVELERDGTPRTLRWTIVD